MRLKRHLTIGSIKMQYETLRLLHSLEKTELHMGSRHTDTSLHPFQT